MHSRIVVAACAVDTPAYLFDQRALLKSARKLQDLAHDGQCHVLYSLKACPLADILQVLAPLVDGFSCSSVFEVQLALTYLTLPGQTVHYTTPGIANSSALAEVTRTCNYVSFNSLEQWERFSSDVQGIEGAGIRLNPGLRLLEDSRYDPCRPSSKLGVPLSTFRTIAKSMDAEPPTGILVHNNCESTDVRQLVATLEHLESHLSEVLEQLEWLNLGGGYLLDRVQELEPLADVLRRFRDRYKLIIFLEPGAAFVQSAGYLVASVIDIFEREHQTIAVLDTTVNHWPEVFEYQFEPDCLSHTPSGRFDYVLAGCSCLAGDVLGRYSFEAPLKLGSRVVFANAGAYSYVKAHMFNGINLPAIYFLTVDEKLVLKRRFTYEDFLARYGGNAHATL